MVEATRPTTPLPAAAFRAFRAFRDRFRGEIVTPDDPGYEGGRRVWNAMWDRRPALIVRPLDPDDVAAAIRFGREA
ncbi:MAG TPA: hypothetical protein VFI34_07265, partial [Candidatus Limnocylindrales bacterium]|nr:hypothetical protein [Candidatus Limnocylindrales bacterium]